MLKRIFGKKGGSSGSKELPAPNNLAAPAPTAPLETMKVFDKFGREFQMPKEAWRTGVLPGSIRDAWNDADRLYGVIVISLNDGFFTDVLDATRRLVELEPGSPRAACAYGIALTKTGREDEAGRQLESFSKTYGEDGSVLTNLAKVYSQQGREDETDLTLWRALEVDPNLDNGLAWYRVRARERAGEAEGNGALRRVAALSKSWRAQLWLARQALETGQFNEAMDLYKESLGRMDDPAPSDGLIQISGDLGNAGHLSELLELCLPKFEPEAHGLVVGNNLIKASIDTGQLDQARRLLSQLNSLQRPDWRNTLNFWDGELARARIKLEGAPIETPLNVALLTFDGPIWAGQKSPAHVLLPNRGGDPLVCFLGSSAKTTSNVTEITRQLTDGPGRASRAIPLYFAEYVYFNSEARTRTLIPWISDGSGGFVLSGFPEENKTAANYANECGSDADWLVLTHLRCDETPWRLEARLIRVSDGSCIETTAARFDQSNFNEVFDVARMLPAWLSKNAGIIHAEPSGRYLPPGESNRGDYLLRLEQLLALRCANIDGAKESVSGVREMIQGFLELCLRSPNSVNARFILAQGLSYLQNVEPSVTSEFASRVRLLQKEKPLSPQAHAAIDAAIEQLLPPIN
jgi:tetratricopeptide (TPR) repeat protein